MGFERLNWAIAIYLMKRSRGFRARLGASGRNRSERARFLGDLIDWKKKRLDDICKGNGPGGLGTRQIISVLGQFLRWLVQLMLYYKPLDFL